MLGTADKCFKKRRQGTDAGPGCGLRAISEAEAVVGFSVYFCAFAEELPVMWVDGDLDKVPYFSARPHTRAVEQHVVIVTAVPKIWRICEFYTHTSADSMTELSSK